MRNIKLLILILILLTILQGCGIYNYHKARKLKEELTLEQKRNSRLIKKRDDEYSKLQVLKDSIRFYKDFFKTK
jgi:cell division protein FtsL